ncbi:hypothetical protein [Methylocella tundrae]|uniref:Uncharacterized protein n=1 Tax=Methylocella tundrae TaxID=227605 RepID=A0A4U8YY38_METTU|nr:hypothetical protein [Methylocella tundrae]WPP05880.1 hypothetical protein SIN04_08740 [Methylocella tundrae]VFU08408.1 conserved protein of unknown function [Methylocella tundrae]
MSKPFSKPAPPAINSAAPAETAETALARVDAERLAAIAERDALIGRRAALFAGNATDEEIEAVDVAIAHANRTIERRQLALPALRGQAEEARRASTEAEFVAVYDAYKRAQNDFLIAYHTAVETRDRLAALIDAGAATFPGRFLAYAAYPQAEYLTLEHAPLAAFEAEAERALSAESRRRKGEW